MVNNRQIVVVDRGQEPFRVLYVGGRPNWEFKFLNRAIEDDPQVQMVSLIRVARREPKFAFQRSLRRIEQSVVPRLWRNERGYRALRPAGADPAEHQGRI